MNSRVNIVFLGIQIMKEPKIFFKTVIKEVPDEVVENDEYRTYKFNANNEAEYLQPTVPLIVELQVISPQEYQKKEQEITDFIMVEKGGSEQIFLTSLNKAYKKATINRRWNNKTGQVSENQLFNDLSDESVDLIWDLLDLDNEECKHSRQKRWFLISLMGDSKNQMIIAKAAAMVFYIYQIRKITAKAQREMRMKYIKFNDKRLYNQQLGIECITEYGTLDFNHVFTVPQMLQVLKERRNQNAGLLEVKKSEYSYDYFNIANEIKQLEYTRNKSEYEIKELEKLKEIMTHMEAMQDAFMRTNTWDFVCKEISDEPLEREVFPTEYDLCLFEAMYKGLQEDIKDLNFVLEHAEDYLQPNDNSPFFIVMGDKPRFTPQTVFPLNMNTFIKTNMLSQAM